MPSRNARPGPAVGTWAAGWKPCKEVLPDASSIPHLHSPYPLPTSTSLHRTEAEIQMTEVGGASVPAISSNELTGCPVQATGQVLIQADKELDKAQPLLSDH